LREMLSRFEERRMTRRRVARFFLLHDTKTGKMYQMVIKYSKCMSIIPNGHKIY
jgi:hypothetical protein